MHWQFGEMKFGEMKRNTSNWSNFCMLLRRAGLTASAGLSCLNQICQKRCKTATVTIEHKQQVIYDLANGVFPMTLNDP